MRAGDCPYFAKKNCQDFDRTPGIFALQFVVLKDLKGHTCTNKNVLIDSFAPRLTVLLSQTTVAFRQFSTHAPHWKANAGQPKPQPFFCWWPMFTHGNLVEKNPTFMQLLASMVDTDLLLLEAVPPPNDWSTDRAHVAMVFVAKTWVSPMSCLHLGQWMDV